MRSDADKEKTKMRERKRRAITTKIFQGLRKHGGYRLSPRADINQVLRELARESGWTIMPDGTTFRSKASNGCPVCAITPTTSSVVNTVGECSTTTSPRPLDPAFGEGGGSDSTYYLSSGGDGNTFYNMYYPGTGGAGIQLNTSDVYRAVGAPHHQQPYTKTITQSPEGN